MQQSNIIPRNWQPTRQPMITNNLAQFNFRGGQRFSAYPHQIVLTEFIGTQEWRDIASPQVLASLIYQHADLVKQAI